jgi:hypothetical protein
MCLFTFGIDGVAGSSFFKLLTESKVVFTLGRIWSTTSLFDKSKANYSLVERDRSRDEACNGIDICINVPVRLTSLAMHIKGLLNSGGQQMTN